MMIQNNLDLDHEIEQVNARIAQLQVRMTRATQQDIYMELYNEFVQLLDDLNALELQRDLQRAGML